MCKTCKFRTPPTISLLCSRNILSYLGEVSKCREPVNIIADGDPKHAESDSEWYTASLLYRS